MHPTSAYRHAQRPQIAEPCEAKPLAALIALKTKEGYSAEIYQDRQGIYKAKILLAAGQMQTLDVVADGMRKIWQKLQEPGCCAYIMPLTDGKRALYVGSYGLIGGMPPKSTESLSPKEIQKYYVDSKLLSGRAYSAGTLTQADMPQGYRLIHQVKLSPGSIRGIAGVTFPPECGSCPGNLRMFAAEEISTGRLFVATGGTDLLSLSNLVSDVFIALGRMDPWIDEARNFIQEVKTKTDKPIFLFTGHSKAQAISEPMAYENNAFSFSLEGPGVKHILENQYGNLDTSRITKFFSFNAESLINTLFPHAGNCIRIDLIKDAQEKLVKIQEALELNQPLEYIVQKRLVFEYDDHEPFLLLVREVLTLHSVDNLGPFKPGEAEKFFSPEKPKPNIIQLTKEYLENDNWSNLGDGKYPIPLTAYPAFVPPSIVTFSVEKALCRPRVLSHVEQYILSLKLSFRLPDGFYHKPPGRHSYVNEYSPWLDALVKIRPLVVEKAKIEEDLERLLQLHREILIAIKDLCWYRSQSLIVFSKTLKMQRLVIGDKSKEIDRIIVQVQHKLNKPVAIPSCFKPNTEQVVEDWRVINTYQGEVLGSFYSHFGGARETTGQTFAGFYEKEAWHIGNKKNSRSRSYIQTPKRYTLVLKAEGKADRPISLSRQGPSGHTLSYNPVSFDIRNDRMVLCLRSFPTEFIVDDKRGQKQKHGYRCNRGIFRSHDRARIEVINLLNGDTIRSVEFASDFPRRVEFINGNEITVEHDNGTQSIFELVPRSVRLQALKTKQQEHLQKLEAFAKQGQWQHLQMETDNPDSAFDWWMFPIDLPSLRYDDQYTISRADIHALKPDLLWMKNYRDGVILVAKSWGWDLENQQDRTNSVQRWTGCEFRLKKMRRSLSLFEQDDLLQALDHFEAGLPEVSSPVDLPNAFVRALSQSADLSAEVAPGEREAGETADRHHFQAEIEATSLTNPAAKRRKIG